MHIVIHSSFILLLSRVAVVLAWDRPKLAEPGQFPHQVSIEWALPPSIAFIHSCSGAIISDVWVLTSAYCIFAIPIANLRVSAGYHNISVRDEHVQASRVDKTIVYPKYIDLTDLRDLAPYDFGLIKLRQAFIFNDRVAPLKLPRKKGWFSSYKLDYNLVLSGWGSIGYASLVERVDVMRTVHLPVVPNKICTNSIRTIHPQMQLVDTQICTRPLDGSLAACIADNGSPLIQYEDNLPVLIGVLTWNWSPCNTYGIPPVYSRISPFVKWIDKQMKNH